MGSSQPLPIYLIHYGAEDWVRRSCESVRASTVPVQVTVINNDPRSSLDLGENVRVVNTGGNLGYSGGANVAIRDWLSGDSEFCVVGSHDLHLDPTSLETMFDVATAHPRIGILGPGLTTNAVGQLVEVRDELELRSMVSGTCMLLRRDCIEEIGGFDELFGSYAEDDELCARAWRAHWLVGRVPGAGGRGLGSQVPDRRRHRYPNLVLLQYRNRGLVPALRVVAGHGRVGLAAIIRGDRSEAVHRLRGIVVGCWKLARAVLGSSRAEQRPRGGASARDAR